MKKIILEIPKDHIEEVIHLIRYAMCEEAVSNDVWTLLMPFCEKHSIVKYKGNEEAFLSYSTNHKKK